MLKVGKGHIGCRFLFHSTITCGATATIQEAAHFWQLELGGLRTAPVLNIRWFIRNLVEIGRQDSILRVAHKDLLGPGRIVTHERLGLLWGQIALVGEIGCDRILYVPAIIIPSGIAINAFGQMRK